jgi:hypothetical protein
MRKLLAILFLWAGAARAQSPLTPFERSGGLATSTYDSCITYYRALASRYPAKIHLLTMGPTDAGYPLNLVLYSNDGSADPKAWHRNGKVVVLVNNGIHPGEPDGVDASMMLLRDLADGKARIPDNVALAVIPLYNIGGGLDRGPSSRVNQNGPLDYGFRGNAQNLDLNRDFTKSDSRNAVSFARIFHYVDPHILIDNHVSDGADYQHTMTLLPTQPDKLGGRAGRFLHDVYLPALFRDMAAAGDQMVPYVNFEDADPGKGWDAFYDPPRFSSGYAALFQTLSFMPETHMLKPFADRVRSTYRLMTIMIREAGQYHQDIVKARAADRLDVARRQGFALAWKTDQSRSDTVDFKGYAAGHKPSEVSGLPRLYYDHSRPFERQVQYFDYSVGIDSVTKPRAYIIPQGWHGVTDLLALNGVVLRPLVRDTVISVHAYHIDSYKSQPRAYERHHRNTDVKVSVMTQTVHFRKGDLLVPMGYATDRFAVEMLEPTGDDSYFSWNFFDAILQEKEGYSAYRLEDVAGAYLRDHPEVRDSLEKKKQSDPGFAANGAAQLDYVYRHSPWFEPEFLRYPVYRVE